jgi:hypothetical protein
VHFKVSCSKGTYIRTLARDIGRKIGCGGHLIRLRRLRNGPFTLERAVSWNILTTGSGPRVLQSWLIFPGVIGGICLLMAFYSLGVLPVNYAGVLLIVLAIGLFIAELFTHSFGILTAGGTTSLVLGSLILFKGVRCFK